MSNLVSPAATVEIPSKKNLVADNNCGLTPSFWKEFIASTWEKNDFVKKNNFVKPPISEEELFKCVVDMSARRCEAGGQGDVRIYVKGIEVKENYAPLFPKMSDGNFAGYGKRVSKELGGQPFSFVIDAISMPESLKVWTHNFLKDIFGSLGAVSQGNFWSIFFGDYKKTPYGVHQHSNPLYSENAFYFPIVGEKEMTVWPASYADENPDLKDSFDYANHLHAATRLSAQAGGMMYWPSDRWHIGSSAGGDVSVVLAVKAFSDVYVDFLDFIVDQDMLSRYKPSGFRKWLCPAIEKLMVSAHITLLRFSESARKNQVRELPFNPADLQASAQVIPEGIKKLGQRLNIQLYFGKNIEKVLSVFWMFYLTNLGMESHNPPFPAIKLVAELQVGRSYDIVLLWRQVDSETILLVADRYAHEIPVEFLPVVKYFAGIEAGQEIVYGDLMNLLPGLTVESEKYKEELAKLLRFLGESGTFKSSAVASKKPGI